MNPTTTDHHRGRPTRPGAGGLGLATAMVVLAACGSSSSDGVSTSPELYTVTRGSLPIMIKETAELKAANETRIKSEIEGMATVIYLIPEGVEVEENEKLVELDVSELVDRRQNQAITVGRANAALISEQENMKILEKEIAAEIAEAKTQLKMAEIDLNKFLGEAPSASESVIGDDVVAAAALAPGADAGRRSRNTNGDMVEALRAQVQGTRFEHLADKVVATLGDDAMDRDMGEAAQQVLEQIDLIALAAQELALNRDKYEKSLGLAEKNYITKNTLEEDRLRYKRSDSQVTLAWNRLDLLISYSLPKERIDLELKFNNAQLTVEKTEAGTRAKRARGEADLGSQEKEYNYALERLQNYEKQIDNAVIRAPGPGLVVYATQGDGRRGRETVEEGTSVRDRQTLIVLPDLRNMIAEMKVQEADVSKVRVGQKAVITIDTFPGEVFYGRVIRVSPIADSGSRWTNNNLKVYKTSVEIEGANGEGDRPQLRPNMTAQVEILVGQKDDVLAVPLTAVRLQGSVHYVWKRTPAGSVASRVEIGISNLSMVEIVSGVDKGDEVYLAEPAVAPEFEQPARPKFDTELPEGLGRVDPRRGPEPADGVAENGGEPGGRGRGDPESRAAYQRFVELVADKLPEYADEIRSDPMALMRNEELRAQIEADPELAAASAAMREQMRRRFGGRGRGERGAGVAPDGNGRRGRGAPSEKTR